MADPQDTAEERQRELAEATERILNDIDPELDDHAYPVRREELAARYGDSMLDLPNETESLGDVFDRLTDDAYETPREAREAVLNEVTGEGPSPGEYNDERNLEPDAGETPGTIDARTEAGAESAVEREPLSDPEAVPEEDDPEGVYDGAEPVEPDDREPES